MKKMIQWVLAAILFGAATLTGCKKDNPNNGNSSNNQWVAETLTFKVNDSSDGFIMKKVEGGDYSMEYMYETKWRPSQERSPTFTSVPSR